MMLLFYRLYKVRELNIITEKHNNYQCKYIDEQNIAVIFTPPKFSNNEIPLQNDIVNFSLAGLNGNNLFALNVGNPHLIIKYEEKLDAIKLEEISLQISQSEFFPEGININWLNIKSKDHIQILTYERGVGFTNACGSGAIASAIYAYLIHGFGPEILVSMPGGDLKVIWTGYEHPPILIGAAEIEEFK
jgi:diaminopimelate epimerase